MPVSPFLSAIQILKGCQFLLRTTLVLPLSFRTVVALSVFLIPATPIITPELVRNTN